MAIGRPRAFDRDEALNRALEMFWRKGYEGASLADLTSAMGINPPSLYAAFGNKEGLFRAALDRYMADQAVFFDQILAAPTSREVAEALLRGVADLRSDPDRPPGCLTVQGALSGSAEAEPIRQELARRRAATDAALRRRFERALAEGDLPEQADPAALARYLTTLTQGMAVQAAGGASAEDLQQVVEIALRAWPPHAGRTGLA